MQALTDILNQAKSEISDALELQVLEQIRVKYLGKKGQITDVLKNLNQLSAEEKPIVGQAANLVKKEIHALIQTWSSSGLNPNGNK